MPHPLPLQAALTTSSRRSPQFGKTGIFQVIKNAALRIRKEGVAQALPLSLHIDWNERFLERLASALGHLRPARKTIWPYAIHRKDLRPRVYEDAP
jgi:hypothetical protein